MAGAMRRAASYGIVDRRLLFGRYLHRMSLEGMATYLFLVLAADRDGRSYYRDSTIGEILRLGASAIAKARSELLAAGLIDYRAPDWWLKSLSAEPAPLSPPAVRPVGRRGPPGPAAPPRGQACPPAVPPQSDPRPIRGAVPAALRELIRSLEETR